MTVNELIRLLSDIDGDVNVFVNDDLGPEPVFSVEPEEGYGVLIDRDRN